MTIKEAQKLSNGVYEIFWKSGGSSLASVGRLHNGKPWLAPANWTSKDAMVFRADYWRHVDHVSLIKKSPKTITKDGI